MRRMGITTLCVVAVVVLGGVVAATASATSYGAAAWGDNERGELGDDTTTSSDVPAGVSELSEVAAVSAGDGFSLALLKNGTVEAWGENGVGQLGVGTRTNSDVPVAVSGLGEVAAISAGGGFGLALLKNGTVKAWGDGSAGDLGDGSEAVSSTPVTVSGLSEVVAISAGGTFGLALLKSGTVKAWGENEALQLGDGGHASSDVPVAVRELSEVEAISAGSGFSLALLKSGKVKAWGYNGGGQLGDGSLGGEACVSYYCSSTPVEVTELTEVAAVSAGGGVGLALLKNGKVKAWGSNFLGELGDGTTTGENCHGLYCSTAPVEVSELSEVTAVSAGGLHSLALLKSGAVYAWGDNSSGQLGDSTKTASDVPVSVTASLTGMSEVAGISAGGLQPAGGEHSLAYGPSIPAGGAVVPVVTGVSPNSGPTEGGTVVEISGEKLNIATGVEFGGTKATSFEVKSPTSMTATAPAGTPRTVNVTVIGLGGHSSAISAGDKFTFVPGGAIEFGKCVKVGIGEGKYKNVGCTELPGPGRYEWTPGFTKASFTSADATETVETVVKPKAIELETVGKVKLVCQNESGTGKYAGTKQVSGMVIEFTGCEFGGTKCSSSGAAEGEITTSVIEGALGWRETEGNKIGLSLTPAGEAELFMGATCGSTTIAVRGSVIGVVTAVDKMSSTFTLLLGEKKGMQQPEAFEGESKEVLEMSVSGGAYEQVGLAADLTLTSEEGLEINTVA
jgi:alpha-tubulin suppressor-like RCC1 family protein